MVPLFLAWRVKKLIREGGTLRVWYISSRMKYGDFYSHFLVLMYFPPLYPPIELPLGTILLMDRKLKYAGIILFNLRIKNMQSCFLDPLSLKVPLRKMSEKLKYILKY